MVLSADRGMGRRFSLRYRFKIIVILSHRLLEGFVKDQRIQQLSEDAEWQLVLHLPLDVGYSVDTLHASGRAEGTPNGRPAAGLHSMRWVEVSDVHRAVEVS